MFCIGICSTGMSWILQCLDRFKQNFVGVEINKEISDAFVYRVSSKPLQAEGA